MNSDSRATLRKFAEEFADDLFTNGSDQKADRLVLTVDSKPPRDLGGWGKGVIIDKLVAALLLREGRQREAKDPEGWCPHCGTLKGGWHAKGCEYERFKPRPNVEEGVGASPLDDVLANVNAALTKAGSRHIVGTKDGQIVSCTIDEIIDGRYRNGERVTVIDAERKER